MAFRIYSQTADLPPVGAGRESNNCDFKAQQDLAKAWEMAKDVAAFANASGGTLLIGANEDPSTGTIKSWTPITEADAAAIATAYNNAAKDWCSPRPLVESIPIEREPGKFALAVNVWPFPLLPISVRRKTDPAHGKSPDAWIVFVRVGRDNVPFTPEQSAMLMIPKIRNAMTLLESIPPPQRANITGYFAMPQMSASSNNPQHSWRETRLDLVEVRPHEGVAVFTGADAVRQEKRVVLAKTPLHIPLGAIESVWSQANKVWCFSFHGQVSTSADQNFYTPNL